MERKGFTLPASTPVYNDCWMLWVGINLQEDSNAQKWGKNSIAAAVALVVYTPQEDDDLVKELDAKFPLVDPPVDLEFLIWSGGMRQPSILTEAVLLFFACSAQCCVTSGMDFPLAGGNWIWEEGSSCSPMQSSCSLLCWAPWVLVTHIYPPAWAAEKRGISFLKLLWFCVPPKYKSVNCF